MAEGKTNGSLTVVGSNPVTIPAQIAKTAVGKKRRVSPRQLTNYQRDIVLAFAPHLLPTAMSALLDKVKERDMRAIEKALQIFDILKEGSGVSIVNQNFNAAMAASAAQSDRSVDQIIRRLAEQEQR